MLGAVVTNDEEIARKLNRTQYAMGYSISADDAWLALRGVRTMPIRMAQHARNALQVCEFFKSRPETVRLFHPPGPRIPAMRVAARLHRLERHAVGGAAPVARERAQVRRRADAVRHRLFLGRLREPGAAGLAQDLSKHRYWGEGQNALVRLHIGLESTEDVIADLAQALDQAK